MVDRPKVFFSKREEIYKIKWGRIHWTGKSKIWHWNNISVGVEKPADENIVLLLRSDKVVPSTFINCDVGLRYVLAFDVKRVYEPVLMPSIKTGRYWDDDRERWVIKLTSRPSSRYNWSEDYWIWDYAVKDLDIKSSYIWKLYQEIQDKLISKKVVKHFKAFDVEEDFQERIIPLIYQPSVDSLKNFVREVHTHEFDKAPDGFQVVEVSILFNNEMLRRHSFFGVLNKIYEVFRRYWYGRVFDVETFHVIVRRERPDKFLFEGIYSCDCHNMEDDNIHGDRKPAKERRIKYSFKNHNHPVVFVNTSNHAMAQADTNHRLWKWEYIPWLTSKDRPIKFGMKSRREIDQEFKPAHLKRLIDWIISLYN
jgi:hypothetical protein